MDYFFANDQDQRGPYPVGELIARGLRPDSLVWREGMGDWQRADGVPELAALFRPASGGPGVQGGAPSFHAPPQQSTPQYGQQPIQQYAAPPYVQGYPPQVPGAYPPYGQNPAYYGPPASLPAGLSVTSMILGILSLFVCFWQFSIPCAILAISFAVVARGKISRGEGGGAGMAAAGLVCGCIALALDALIIILLFMGLSMLGGFR